MTHQITTIAGDWNATAEQAALTPTDRSLFAGRQFLNPYCIDGLDENHAALQHTFEEARRSLTD